MHRHSRLRRDPGEPPRVWWRLLIVGRICVVVKPYPEEVKQQAARLVLEHQGDYRPQYELIRSIAAKTIIGTECLR